MHIRAILLRRRRFSEELERTGELLCELGSDQTSCHNPHLGGYYPVQVGMPIYQSKSIAQL